MVELSRRFGAIEPGLKWAEQYDVALKADPALSQFIDVCRSALCQLRMIFVFPNATRGI